MKNWGLYFVLFSVLGCVEGPKTVLCPTEEPPVALLPEHCIYRLKKALDEKGEPSTQSLEPASSGRQIQVEQSPLRGWMMESTLGETRFSLECHCPGAESASTHSSTAIATPPSLPPPARIIRTIRGNTSYWTNATATQEDEGNYENPEETGP